MRRGVMFGVAAYGMWGLFPLFFPLLQPADATEILAHRMIWSLVVSAVVLTAVRGWRTLRGLGRSVWLLVAAGAALIAVNWGVYIWAVNDGHVVEAALGYFVNPLVSVLLGVVIFRERLRRLQWTAVGLGVLAVVVLAVTGGGLLWIAVVLACSFALYGLVKKVIPLPPTSSLTAEGLVLVLPALAYLAVLGLQGSATFVGFGAGHTLLLVSTGLVTCGPLLAFAAAARALPLSVLGLLQYLTPVLQFLLGVFWFGESMPLSRWAGFALVWLALMVLSADALRHARSAATGRSGQADAAAGR